MPNGSTKQILKHLLIDTTMALSFLGLLGFAAWLIYIYFMRGPIDIETRGFVSRTIQTEEVQPFQVEKYKLKHFHNLDDVVLAGIQSKSLCIECHSDYPHVKDNKTRSFFNAHSWFIACEVCHMKHEDSDKVIYRWLDPDTGKTLTSLNGQSGVYGGLIVPIRINNGDEIRLDVLSDKEQIYTEEFILLRKNLNKFQIDLAQERIHKPLSKTPVFCDGCHIQDGMLNFSQLLYSPQRASHLASLDMAAMVKTYKEFHLPALINSK